MICISVFVSFFCLLGEARDRLRSFLTACRKSNQ